MALIFHLTELLCIANMHYIKSLLKQQKMKALIEKVAKRPYVYDLIPVKNNTLLNA